MVRNTDINRDEKGRWLTGMSQAGYEDIEIRRDTYER